MTDLKDTMLVVCAVFAALFLGLMTLELGVIAYEQVENCAIGRHIAEQNDNPNAIEGPPLIPMPSAPSSGGAV